MNGHRWREFYLQAYNPVVEGKRSFVDLAFFSPKDYPALERLRKQHSTLEILLLGQLILLSENDDPQDRYCSETTIEEHFANYDCTAKDLRQALFTLETKKRVEMVVDEEDGLLYFRANISQLISDGIYTDNHWRDLYRLSLYGPRISKN